MFEKIVSQGAPAPEPMATGDSFEEHDARRAELLEQYVLARREDRRFDPGRAQERSSTAVNLPLLRSRHFCVLGAGGIGAWVVRMLVGMGVEMLTVIDHDTVEIHNVAPQGYGLMDIGLPKVEALRQEILEQRFFKIRAVQAKVEDLSHLAELCGGMPDFLITAVDNMTIRRRLFDGLDDALAEDTTLPELFIDARMSLGAWNVFTLPLRRLDLAHQATSRAWDIYRDDGIYFDDAAAVQEHCTERAINYTGASVAGYIAALIHWWTGTDLPPECVQQFLDASSDGVPFHWLRSFNARLWRDGTQSPREQAMRAELATLRTGQATAEETIEHLQAELDALRAELAHARRAEPEDMDGDGLEDDGPQEDLEDLTLDWFGNEICAGDEVHVRGVWRLVARIEEDGGMTQDGEWFTAQDVQAFRPAEAYA